MVPPATDATAANPTRWASRSGGVQMRVVGPDGEPLPAGPDSVGEILISGHNVMEGYHNNPDGTAAALREGWLSTGDLGYVDEDGFFFIVDRLKDLVIRGGYNVYPREVEEVLYGHPSIAEAAVLGRPHEVLGEEVVQGQLAVVVLVGSGGGPDRRRGDRDRDLHLAARLKVAADDALRADPPAAQRSTVQGISHSRPGRSAPGHPWPANRRC